MVSFMKQSIAAITALAATSANAHMIMKTPTPYSAGTLDNSPLTGAANFPCKAPQGPQAAKFYNRDGITTKMAIGEPQTLSFIGSAVHGGGSCQLAITEDLQPTASSSWQVILSLEGGCPTKDGGSSASEYEFKIPASVAPKEYTFAWTWMSKLAGQPEYYMNCAPIEVTAGSAKRSEGNATMELLPRDDAALPELFVANLQGINDCKTEPSTDPEFPNPGPNVERPNPNAKYSKVKGENCVPSGAKAGGGSGSGAGGNPSDGGADNGSDSGSGSGDGSGSGNSPAPTTSAAEQPSSGFMTAPVVAPTSTDAAATPSSDPAAAPTSAASPPEASTPAAAPTSDAAPPAASTPAAAPSSGSGSGSGAGLTGACTDEGTFNCDGTSYQQCASGEWTAMQALPGGTTCTQGMSANLWARSERKSTRWARRI